MTRQDFVSTYLMDALKSQMMTGTPVLVTLAQAALESGWGRYAKGFNFFGIKAGKSWKGETQLQWTREFEDGKWKRVQARFRKYQGPAQSFADHGMLLKDRFPLAFKFADPEGFIRSVQHDHLYKYATDPDYVNKMVSIIKSIRNIIIKMEI